MRVKKNILAWILFQHSNCTNFPTDWLHVPMWHRAACFPSYDRFAPCFTIHVVFFKVITLPKVFSLKPWFHCFFLVSLTRLQRYQLEFRRVCCRHGTGPHHRHKEVPSLEHTYTCGLVPPLLSCSVACSVCCLSCWCLGFNTVVLSFFLPSDRLFYGIYSICCVLMTFTNNTIGPFWLI